MNGKGFMNSSICMPNTFPVTCHTDFVGPGSTFVAIEGYVDNGIKYIKQAIEKGARNIVVHRNVLLDDELLSLIKLYDIVTERVDNTRKALAELSAQAANFPAKKLNIIGITGTKGKTTTAFLLEHILYTASYKTALISSAKNRICGHDFSAPLTTPQPDYLQQFLQLCVNNGVEYVVMEVAAQALTLHRVEGVIFCGIIFTNFSLEHLEFYPTLADYFYAKTLIFNKITNNALLIINSDDEHGQQLLAQYASARSYGFKNSDNATTYAAQFLVDPTAIISLYIKRLSLKFKNIKFPFALVLMLRPCSAVNALPALRSFNEAESKDIPERSKKSFNKFRMNAKRATILGIKSNDYNKGNEFNCPMLFGAYNAYNVLAATSMSLELKIEPAIIQQALRTFAGVPGRLEEHILPNGARCFIDYAHNPESFNAVLSTLRALTTHLIVVFGAGGGRDASKRPMMGNIASQIADIVVVTSDNPRLEDATIIAEHIICGIPEALRYKIVQELDRQKAIEFAYQLSDQGSIIALLGKGPDEYQIIGTTKHYFSEKTIIEQL